MKESLVQHLICPKCSQNLVVKSSKTIANEIVNGILSCSKKHKFFIKNGVPKLVVDKEKIFVKTEDSFSSKWENYNKTYHSKKWIKSQKKWFLERFGWKRSNDFEKFLKTRTKILDAGTVLHN